MPLTGRALAAAGLLVAGLAHPAAAQQGSIQVSGSAQAVHGDPQRLGGQPQLEPDFGVSWLQPSKRSGTYHAELRATQRYNEAHLGRAFFAWRDARLRGATWNFEAGDFYFMPTAGDYRFTNLVTPTVTLAGASVSARTSRSSLSLVAGRVTAWRNIFGSDPDTLAQSVGLARATHKPVPWLDLNARASRVRTRDVTEFGFSISASDEAGAGVRATLGPSVYVVSDGGYSGYKRVGSNELIHDWSATGGVSFLHARGWLQANVSRFSPGSFPVINYSLSDRSTVFAAGEHDLFRQFRIFGGWERFRGNLDPARSASSPTPAPETAGTRAFGGFRIHFLERNSFALRVEEGDRRSRPHYSGLFVDSDTGAVTGDLQSQFGRVTSSLRYSRRENVEGLEGASYLQTDGTMQLFVNVSRGVQLFGTAVATRNQQLTGIDTSHYQAGGGGQFQLRDGMLWLRLEGLTGQDRDSFNAGFNGQVARNTMLGFNVFADRGAVTAETSPWLVRSALRVTRTFNSGTARLTGPAAGFAAEARVRGTGSIIGSVFADWNGNGIPDPDEESLEGIPILLGTSGATTTSARGDFAFTNVPTGVQRVQVDPAALPVDFDPPDITPFEVELARGDTRRVAFGLVPLGSVTGRVFRDANGNGTLDTADEPIEGAVLILDGGLRSEQVRKGRFRFDAVRSGTHAIELLLESLPEGATIIGERRLTIGVTRTQQLTTTDFLVSVEKRPEIRKVFPPKGGGGSGASAAAVPARPAPPRPGRDRRPAAPAAAGNRFTIQIAALGSLARAEDLVAELKAAGQMAYIVEPRADDPNGLYRVRVGRFASSEAAKSALPKLERLRGERLWVIRGQ